MAAFTDLTETARRLLNMEVNTIVAAAMTAEPMPAVPHALLDIAGWYAAALARLGVDLVPYFAPDAAAPESITLTWVGASTPAGSDTPLTVSTETFDRLRWAAKRARSAPEAARRIPPPDLALLDRVVNNSDAIKAIFTRFDKSMDQFRNKTREALLEHPFTPHSYRVAPDDLALLQKIWDIGTDEIVAQTIVYVTGDITTRVQGSLAGAESAPLFAIHRQSIDVSINCWKLLLDAVREIAGATVRVLLGTVK